MAVQPVDIADDHARFIRESIDAGRYGDASEVIRAGLQLLELEARQEAEKLTALQRLTAESFAQLDRGEYEVVNPGDIDDFIERADARARARLAARR